MKKFLPLAVSIVTLAFAHPRNYIDALRSYTGSRYLDVTCSALICKAHNRVSTAEANCTAEELWDGCEGELGDVAASENLALLDWSRMQAGDIVDINGIHVLAYLGDGKCITSDPMLGGVNEITVSKVVEKKYDQWFSGPVRVKRWNR
jgi:hypothetical protein